MRILVIPDVHLKPWMFDRAASILKSPGGELNCVCLGDLPDDFGKQKNIALYESTFNAAIQFHTEFPSTLWCYGNHEFSYMIKALETGYSVYAETTVVRKIRDLSTLVGNKFQVVHRIDNVLFSHGGVERSFALHVAANLTYSKNIDHVVKEINEAKGFELWNDLSPIWFRPQVYTERKTYYPRKLLQVVGHTPVKKPYLCKGVLSCDTFSTHRDGSPYGT